MWQGGGEPLPAPSQRAGPHSGIPGGGPLPLRQTQRSPEGPRHRHRIPRLSEAPWEVPQLEETPETPPSSRAEGLLFLHGLESNPGSSLQRKRHWGVAPSGGSQEGSRVLQLCPRSGGHPASQCRGPREGHPAPPHPGSRVGGPRSSLLCACVPLPSAPLPNPGRPLWAWGLGSWRRGLRCCWALAPRCAPAAGPRMA